MKRKINKSEWKWYWIVALNDACFRERNSDLYRKLDHIFHTELFTRKEKIGNEDELYPQLESKL